MSRWWKASEMEGARTMSIDLGGEDGGRLAGAFAAGCVAAFTFLSLIGKFLWSLIGKTKDDEIGRLKVELDADRERCAAMEVRLVQRIQQLEGFIIAMAPMGGALRQDIQKAISETRVEHGDDR